MANETEPVAPERIYLQHDGEETGEPFPTSEQGFDESITWCRDHIYPTDIEYIRADLAHPLPTPSGVPREPTPHMVMAGDDAWDAHDQNNYLDMVATIWRAMHDAALLEAKLDARSAALAAQGQQTGEERDR
jgi:hypothetical protein